MHQRYAGFRLLRGTVRIGRSARWLAGWIALAASLGGVAGAAVAAPFEAATASFTTLDASQGLSQESVLAMAQDRHGFVWIGTQNGLNRFDGREVRTLPADIQGAGLWVYDLLLDPGGDLWVATANGLLRWHEADENFERFQPVAGRTDSLGGQLVYALLLEEGGDLLIGHDRGLSRWRAGRQRFEDAGIALPDPAGSRQIRALLRAGNEYWFGTSAGLLHVAAGASAATPVREDGAPPALPIPALLRDRSGRLWVGTDGAGLFRRSGGRWQQLSTLTVPGLPSDRILALLQDSRGAVWIGHELGATVIDADDQQVSIFHRRHQPGTLARGRIVSLMEDRQGQIWLGSWDGGASRLLPQAQAIVSLGPDHGLTEGLRRPQINHLLAESRGLLLATGDGLYRLAWPRPWLTSLRATEGLDYYALAHSGERLWLGTGKGLMRLDPGSPPRPAGISGGLATARVRRLLSDPPLLWVAADLQGLSVLDETTLALRAHHALPGNLHNLVRMDPDGVFVSASDGLYHFDRMGNLLARHGVAAEGDDDRLLPAPPTGLVRSHDGLIFVATYGGGVVEMRHTNDQVRFVPVVDSQRLTNPGVNSLAFDDQERLWLATDRGLSMIDLRRDQVRNLGAADGAIARGYYFSAVARLGDGTLAFGSKDGLTLVRPGLADPPLPPAPRILRIERDNRPLAVRRSDPGSPLLRAAHLVDRIDLPPGSGRSLALSFASLDMLLGPRLRYRYRLTGFDDAWVETGEQRRVAFTNLAPGSYDFEVQAIDPLDRVSPITRLQIGIAPTFWQSGVAHALILLAAAALIAATHFLRLRHLRRQRRELALLVEERTRDLERARARAEAALAETHRLQQEVIRTEKLAALGGLIAGLAHEINTPLGVALTAASHLGDRAGQVAQDIAQRSLKRPELQRFVDDASEATKLLLSSLKRTADLVATFRQLAVDRGGAERCRIDLSQWLDQMLVAMRSGLRQAQLSVDCPADTTLETYPETLAEVLTRLVQNADTHAVDTRTTLHVHLIARSEGEGVRLDVVDDGRGIPEQHLTKVFEPFYTTRRNQGCIGLGLHIVHTLVTSRLGGSVTLTSEPGKGTRVSLVLPGRAP